MVDNLFIIRGVVDHALYLGKELCITFFDIEKCFDGWKTAKVLCGKME